MRIACIGDSLTACGALKEHDKWTYLLSEYDDIVCTNFGISGDTTTGMLTRCADVLNISNFTHCIIFGGTNDFWLGSCVESCIQNIFAMIRRGQYLGKTPILAIPPLFLDDNECDEPFDAFPPIGGYDRIKDRLTSYRKCLIELAGSEGLIYADIYSAFMTDDKPQRIDRQLFLRDGLHFNKNGSRLVAEEIYNSIKK